MYWVKCKNDTEKLEAIEKYCNNQISEFEQRIQWLQANQTSPLDYYDEIHDLKTRIAHVSKILEIIHADEFTSISIY